MDAFKRQIGPEMGASLQCAALAAHFDAASLSGLAHLFYRQAEKTP